MVHLLSAKLPLKPPPVIHHSSDEYHLQGSGGGECRVGSLEVIRGRMQATQIDHSGFSIMTSSMGITIRVSVTAGVAEDSKKWGGSKLRINDSLWGGREEAH